MARHYFTKGVFYCLCWAAETLLIFIEPLEWVQYGNQTRFRGECHSQGNVVKLGYPLS